MRWLAKIKAYWSILLGLLVGGLAIAVKVLSGSNRRLRKENKEAEAQLDHAIDVMETDTELDRARKSKSAEMANDAEKLKYELQHPNKWL